MDDRSAEYEAKQAAYKSAHYEKNKDKIRGAARARYYSMTPKERAEKARNGRLRLRYGITSSEYNELLAKQNGRCAICDGPPTKGPGNNLHVDHCHRTGRVRGLLCHQCNTAIGNLGESPVVIRRAMFYLFGKTS